MNPIILTVIYFIVSAIVVIGLIDTPLIAAGATAFLALVFIHTKSSQKPSVEEEKPEDVGVGGGGF